MNVCVKWPNMQKYEEESRLIGFKRNMLLFPRDSLETWNRVFQAVFAADLLSFLTSYNEHPVSECHVTNERRQRLKENFKRLVAYAEDPTPIPSSVWSCFTPGNREEAVRNECRELAAILTLALGMPGARIMFD